MQRNQLNLTKLWVMLKSRGERLSEFKMAHKLKYSQLDLKEEIMLESKLMERMSSTKKVLEV